MARAKQQRAGSRMERTASSAISREILKQDDGANPFVAAVRAMRMPVIITNPRLPDNPTVFINDAFCRMSGYAREDILNRNCRFLQGPETDPADVALVRAAVEAVEPIQIDIRNHRKDGSAFWNRLFMAPVHDDTGRLSYFFSSQVDVTIERERLVGLENDNAALLSELTDRLRQQEDAERRLLEMNNTLFQQVEAEVAQRLKTEELLRQAQKMEAVGQLTGGLAHDFNNLLTGISGSLEVLESRVKQGRFGELARFFDSAKDAAMRAASLTHRLLAFSRRQTLEPKLTNVTSLASGMTELIRRTIGPSIELEFVSDSYMLSTLVDQSQLENSLLNLCINARDAMPGGGKLIIATKSLRLDEKSSIDHDLPPGEYVTLAVTDNGAGMTPDVVARAFDPFYTTKPIGSGTGLGLSMIYGFAKQSGGQARIQSVAGAGTTVRIFLPRYVGVGRSDDPKLSAVKPSSQSVGTALVVDDEPTVRLLMADALAELGFTVLQADAGPSGIEVLKSKSRIDLLVTDVGLPGMNGRQLADFAQASRPGLKVLFVTGFAENSVLDPSKLTPGMHVLTKPFAMKTFGGRINDIFDLGMPLPYASQVNGRPNAMTFGTNIMQ